MRSVNFTNSNGQSVTLDSSGSEYFITSIEGIDIRGVDSQTQKAPYQNGRTNIDTLFQVRDITIEGIIKTPVDLNAINIARRTLQSVLNPNLGQGNIVYTYDSGSKQIAAKCIACTFANRNMPTPFQAFQIQFECADPYWKSTTSDTTSVGLVTAETSYPIEWTDYFEYSSVYPSSSRLITNNGDVPQPILATIYGPAINPTLINETTGEYIHLIGLTLGTDDKIIINTAFGNKTITFGSGSKASNAMQYLDPLSTFFQLQVGENEMDAYDDSGYFELRVDIAKTDLFSGI